MGKRSRHRVGAPPVRRVATARPRSRSGRWTWPVLAVVGAGIGIVLVLVVVVLLANRPAPLAGLQVSGPPWPPESAHLRDRLQADGLDVLTAEGEALHTHQHLDIYLDGQAIAVPADIGINVAAGYLAPIHTHDTTGIIHVESPTVRDFTLGEFFDVWGLRFDASCLGGECGGNGRVLSVFLNGQPYSGDPRGLVLEAHQEIVIALGTPTQLPNPVPSTYAFPAGL